VQNREEIGIIIIFLWKHNI